MFSFRRYAKPTACCRNEDFAKERFCISLYLLYLRDLTCYYKFFLKKYFAILVEHATIMSYSNWQGVS